MFWQNGLTLIHPEKEEERYEWKKGRPMVCCAGIEVISHEAIYSLQSLFLKLELYTTH